MSVQLGQSEARLRQRFTVPSRTHLSYAMSGTESLTVLLLSGFLLLVMQPLPALVLAVSASLIYGYTSLRAARKFLIYADRRQPFLLHAVVSWPVAALLAILLTMAIFGHALPPASALWGWLIGVPIALLGVRYVVYDKLYSMLQLGQLQMERIAVIGEADAVKRFKSEARIWQRGGHIVASFVLDGNLATNPPAAETMAGFARECIANNCEHMLLVGDLTDFNAIDAIVRPCRSYAINVMLYPTSAGSDRPMDMVDIVPLGPINSLRVLSTPLTETGRVFKRLFDIAGAGIGLLLLSPLLLVIAAIIRLTSSGPALYRQERRGFNGETFKILKFRSMSVMEDGRAMTQAQENDPRITPIGHFIRRTSIDELPQLINVLKGDMSLVGPRPHAISHDAELSHKFDLYAQRQRIRPGITGWAQVNGYRGDTSTIEKIEGRTLHDLYYVENWSLLLDCWIILLTLFSKRTRQNAH
ncbi:exopolysaccharide biosynthesis polyprenyl glycosylphosphotransferase [Devosia sp. 2618]|uniref:exopolysaccharide biosynthesis polyprenyl glycosylphosphotransferase n=1 Tax=Devosia sp. 2618 TaxID=3156454 RepID=UPI0033969267